jgi:PQQ-like domain
VPEGLKPFALLPVLLVLAALLISCGSSQNAPSSSSPPDFSLTVSPSNVALTAGASIPFQVTATASNGFSGSIALAVSGLPSGVTATPANLTLMPGSSATVTLAAAQNTAGESGTAMLTATSATLSHTAQLSMTVGAAQSPPDFTLTVTPASLSLTPGGSAPVQVIATPLNGFTGSIALTISGLPSGVTATPASLTLMPGTSATVTLAAAQNTAAETGTATLSATSGTLSHTAQLSLTVAAAQPPPDFTLGVTPASVSLTAGGTAQTLQVSATALNGFTGTIDVTLSGLPAGVAATPSSLTLTPGAPQTISLGANQTAAAATATVTLTATSSALSHSASVTLAVAAAPTQGIALAANPTALNLAAGGTGQQVSISTTGTNGFTGTVNITLSGVPAGVTASPSTLTLSAGAAQPITFTAAANAPASTGTITIQGTGTGTSGPITGTAALSFAISVPSSAVDVTTYHNDLARTGQDLNESTLTLSNVNTSTFGKINFLNTDGRVDAQPLYVQNLVIGGQTHNVLYTETEHGSVYAFDADTGTQLWQTSVVPAGETTSNDHNCGQITPEIGITATPVIDRHHGVNGSIFVVGMTEQGVTYHQRLHALDLTTGAELAGSPTEIQATYPGNGANSSGGNVVFDPGQYAERVGLLLLNGTLYLGWTSHCDIQPYTGWLMAYSESTLQQTAVLNLTPNGSEGSIWMSGAGLAADSNANIYFLDANGTFDTTLDANGFPSQHDYGNAFLKVSTLGGSLVVVDYFAIDNTVDESNHDTDLGSGGALLLPDVADTSGQIHQLAIGAGKDSNMYIVDRNSMGKFNANNNGALYQEVANNFPSGVFSMPAYFNNTVYYGGVNNPIQAFPIVNARLGAPAAVSSNTFGYPGATPSISANGASNGIVWAVENANPAVLHAYNAGNLQEIYNSNQAGARDSVGGGNKFITPTIANGKVYVGTPNGVAVFGPLP